MVASLAGLQLILIGSLVLSGMILSDRAELLRQENARLTARIESAGSPRPEVLIAGQILAARQARVDWSPKLATIPRKMDSALILSNLVGQADLRGRGSRLALQGRVRAGGQSESVMRLVESLRTDPAMTRDLPLVRVGSVGGEGLDRFEVVCESLGKSS